ncbi:hypothetical protein [Bdellovibrio svalbardensis]|uniref:Uncharacterized protein n=1 Tax=Bdellovibrio svalbardensis TaxID=2972972 RepID=A0ABT6DGH3_9BACT|nr:hypothetical protein [Bdellovibrio svalbardensis]MDG0815345.1 hypothetical protein [Bdellovibrio svalbardensis]
MIKLLHKILILGLLLVSVAAHAAETCGGIFAEDSYHKVALDSALKKAITPDGTVKGLSTKDLEFLVEKVFDQKQGQKYKPSHYWRKTAEERTLAVLERYIGEDVIHHGLLKYFEEHDLLVDKTRFYTKLQVINRSGLFNSAQAAWIAYSAALRGTPPIMLPEVFFKMKDMDKQTLLLKGLQSPEGKVIAKRYGLRQEAIRGYTLISKYYSRVAIAVLAYVVFNKTLAALDEDHKKESDDAFNAIKDKFEKMFGGGEIETKEDVLFDTVLEKFQKKFGRMPNSEEKNQICLKVYGNQGCP